MVLKEIKYRKFNFLLGVIGIATLVTFIVAFYILTAATKKQTALLTRDMGFNVRIIPKGSDMQKFWVEGYSNQTLSEDVIQKLMDKKSINYAHLTATLHKTIIWKNTEVVLTGISKQEKEPSGKKKSKMIFAIPPDKVYVGYEIARKFHLNKGMSINILGKDFVVAKTLSESGSREDIKFFFDLNTLQTLAKLEGKVNEVMAINCMCSAENDNALEVLRKELESVAPSAKVIMNTTIATAREKQRKMTDKYFAVLFPFLLLICGIWIAAVTINNTKERSKEIGIMKALGLGPLQISKLFFVRAFCIGIVGAIVGFTIATWVCNIFGMQIFRIHIKMQPMFSLLGVVVLAAPIFVALVALLPIFWAVQKDTIDLLKED